VKDLAPTLQADEPLTATTFATKSARLGRPGMSVIRSAFEGIADIARRTLKRLVRLKRSIDGGQFSGAGTRMGPPTFTALGPEALGGLVEGDRAAKAAYAAAAIDGKRRTPWGLAPVANNRGAASDMRTVSQAWASWLGPHRVRNKKINTKLKLRQWKVCFNISHLHWYSWVDSNHRPPDPQA
jgi:hypothetical protein